MCLPVGFISSREGREGMRKEDVGRAGEAAAEASGGGLLGLWSSKTQSC